MARLAHVPAPAIELPEERPLLPIEEYLARLEATRRAMAARGLDLLIVYADREHSATLAFLTGVDPRFEEALLLLPASGNPRLLLGNEGLGYGPDRRLELEGPADATLDPAGWTASAARSTLLEHVGERALVELGRSRQLRRPYPLIADGTRVEATVDTVEVVVDDDHLLVLRGDPLRAGDRRVLEAFGIQTSLVLEYRRLREREVRAALLESADLPGADVHGLVAQARAEVESAGTLIDEISVKFEEGRIVEAKASRGADVLNKVLDTDEGARRLGEVALYAEFGFEGALIASNIVEAAATGISVTNFNEGGRLAVVQGNLIRNLFRREHEARADQPAVHHDRAGAAVAGAATFLGTGHVQFITQYFQQRLPRIAQKFNGVAVNGGHYMLLGHYWFPFARASAMAAARRAARPESIGNT